MFKFLEGELYLLKLSNDGLETVLPIKLNESKGQRFFKPAVLFVNKEKLRSVEVQKLISANLWFRVIMDEAHVIRNGDSTYSYESLSSIPQPVVMIKGKKVPFRSRIGLTGTPIQNIENDLVSLFQWINPTLLLTNSTRSQELRNLIRKYLFRRSNDNITPSMKKFMRFPEKPLECITHNFTLKETIFSKDIERYNYSVLKEKAKNSSFRKKLETDERAFVIAASVQSDFYARESNGRAGVFVQGPFLSYPYDDILFGELTYKGKISKLEEIYNIIASTDFESFVIFHSYDPIKDAIRKYLSKKLLNHTFLEINGQQKNSSKKDAILMSCNRIIQNGGKVILLSSTKATCEGLNYQLLHNGIIVDQGANPQNEIQASRRLYRIGQLNHVKIWTMAMSPFKTAIGVVGLDNRLMEIKAEKEIIPKMLNIDNAAWYFRRYTITNDEGEQESGVHFGDEFENQEDGLEGGPNSVGPIEIN